MPTGNAPADDNALNDQLEALYSTCCLFFQIIQLKSYKTSAIEVLY